MNDKMLNGIKNEYQEIKKAIDSDFKELSELEDNPVVQRYNHLRNLQMLAASGEFKDNRGILRYCLTKTGTIEETNNIYVYMFENTIKRLEKTADFFEGYIDRTMTEVGKDSLSTTKVELKYRSSEKVILDDELNVPERFKTMEWKTSKAEIKKALKAGCEVPGAHLEKCRNLQIS